MRRELNEFRIISSFLRHNELLIDNLGKIKPHHFSVIGYGQILEIMLSLVESRISSFDKDIILDRIRSAGVEQPNCNERTLNEMYNGKSFRHLLPAYIKLVTESSIFSHTKTKIDQIKDKIDSGVISDVETLISEVNGLATSLNDRAVEDTCTKLTVDVNDIFEELDKKLESDTLIIDGLKTGIHELDYSLNGLQSGKLYTLMSDSGVGKSTFAIQTALNVCKDRDKSVHYFSLEMPKKEVIEKCLCMLSGINSTFFKNPKLFFCEKKDGVLTSEVNEEKKAHFYSKIQRASEQLNTMNIFIDCDSTINSAKTIYSRAVKQNLIRKTDLIIIDHTDRFCSLTADIASKTKEAYVELKNMANGLGRSDGQRSPVAVLALHQYNKEVYENPDKRPDRNCIKGGQAIINESDVILSIYRPAVYTKLIEEKPELKDVCFIEFFKNRSGPTFTPVDMQWNGIKFLNKEHSFDPALESVDDSQYSCDVFDGVVDAVDKTPQLTDEQEQILLDDFTFTEEDMLRSEDFL